MRIISLVIGVAVLIAVALALNRRSDSTVDVAPTSTTRTTTTDPARGSPGFVPSTPTSAVAVPSVPLTITSTFRTECSPARLAEVLASRGVASASAITTLRCSGGVAGWAFVDAPDASPDTQFLLRYLANTWRVAYAGSDALAAASSLDLLNQGITGPDINILFCQPRQGSLPDDC